MPDQEPDQGGLPVEPSLPDRVAAAITQQLLLELSAKQLQVVLNNPTFILLVLQGE
jgi:hypothetical protein